MGFTARFTVRNVVTRFLASVDWKCAVALLKPVIWSVGLRWFSPINKTYPSIQAHSYPTTVTLRRQTNWGVFTAVFSSICTYWIGKFFKLFTLFNCYLWSIDTSVPCIRPRGLNFRLLYIIFQKVWGAKLSDISRLSGFSYYLGRI